MEGGERGRDGGGRKRKGWRGEKGGGMEKGGMEKGGWRKEGWGWIEKGGMEGAWSGVE